jgi:hypothetical protein
MTVNGFTGSKLRLGACAAVSSSSTAAARTATGEMEI